MIVETSHQVPAAPDRVYKALTDPAVIQRCIDDCRSMTLVGENTYEIRVGDALKGTVKVLNAQPPDSLTLEIEGRALAGSVKASVHLTLAARSDGTQVSGVGDVKVGGFLRALGDKILEFQAREAIKDFFTRLSAQIATSGT